uniref:RNA-directed RNA polymerase n=1 Tax=Leviviridae sp. TaxID=2027243 RepID=A0A514D7L0_9VIRU|nr:MAG: RNA-dependent RNA polymerase [Leviviridae sp.]
MKSLMSLWSQVAEESATRCCTSATADINTVSRRVEHEGLSFLTITLPELGKATQKWLDQGQVEIHSSFSQGRGSLPLFLGGFFSRVFDRSSGTLLENPCVDSILAIRQLTLMFGKISLPCSPARERRAMQNYLECEQDVRQFDMELSEKDIAEFKSMSGLLFRSLFTDMDREVYYGNILPKHGPGSTSDGLSSNEKYHQKNWTSRLEEVFPSYEYLIPSPRFSEVLDQVNILEPGAELPVKVISVPKTLKTPRIIAMEPSWMMFVQQGLLRAFLASFERDELLKKLIGFDDQFPNQELARKGSIDGHTATLDLSDASDRVSNQLVRAMMCEWTTLSRAFDASRSRRAVVPDHGVIRLSKYASMGSALCFPVEAMVFTTLIFLGIQRSLNVSLTRKHIHMLSDSVRVYGDDLIVPVDHVPTVVQTLEHFGARVGPSKSFWTGKFRESCGKEYFNGHDVSIVRVRQMLPCTTADVTEVISAVALRNQLYLSGYWRTVRWLDNRLKKVLKHFPDVEPTSSVLGRVSFLGYQAERMDPRLHRPLVRGYVVEAKSPSDELGGYGALLKCFLKLEGSSEFWGSHTPDIPCYNLTGMAHVNEPSPWLHTMGQDEKHLERSGRPKRVNIKLGWRPPF